VACSVLVAEHMSHIVEGVVPARRGIRIVTPPSSELEKLYHRNQGGSRGQLPPVALGAPDEDVLLPLVSPGTRSVAWEKNATVRPSAEIESNQEKPLACAPSESTETRAVSPVCRRGRRCPGTNGVAGTKLLAREGNVTYRPSAEVETPDQSLSVRSLHSPASRRTRPRRVSSAPSAGRAQKRPRRGWCHPARGWWLPTQTRHTDHRRRWLVHGSSNSPASHRRPLRRASSAPSVGRGRRRPLVVGVARHKIVGPRFERHETPSADKDGKLDEESPCVPSEATETSAVCPVCRSWTKMSSAHWCHPARGCRLRRQTPHTAVAGDGGFPGLVLPLCPVGGNRHACRLPVCRS